ncbi:hypothetical protein INR49_020991 [Caranx melampygus]|nr:hypothetical protein INR49_020991 [Caranx melampygus]
MNPVTNYNNVVEAGSDSDDEDKLHIVEEEGGSLADGADCDSTLPDDEPPGSTAGTEVRPRQSRALLSSLTRVQHECTFNLISALKSDFLQNETKTPRDE